MLTVADRGEGGGGGGDKICQNLADVICERSLRPPKNFRAGEGVVLEIRTHPDKGRGGWFENPRFWRTSNRGGGI